MVESQQVNGWSILVLQIVFILIGLSCLTFSISASVALMMGISFSLLFGNPYVNLTRQVTHRLLQVSIVSLGAGMNLGVIGQVGIQGFGYTALGLGGTLTLGIALGKLLKIEENTSLLITVGTAICGGSAIAAVASTIRAKSEYVSVALATVFFLNASALFIFPYIGHYFALTETQFGLWSALAIHDTSSVVGAAIQYGTHAVEIATTVKLARTLWIIPVSLVIGLIWNCNQQNRKAIDTKRPWFVLGFLFAAALVTWFPHLQSIGYLLSSLAKRMLVLTLFFIGAGFTRSTIQNVGFTPFIQGFFLWFLMASGTLSAILLKWIQ